VRLFWVEADAAVTSLECPSGRRPAPRTHLHTLSTLTSLWSCVQASTSVRHLLLPCHWSQRSLLVPDLVKCYGERWCCWRGGSQGASKLLLLLPS
jgi:hypothetical protein